MAKYSTSVDITSANQSSSGDVRVGDTITFTVYGNFSFSGHSTTNCTYTTAVEGSGSGNVTAIYVVTPTGSGTYSFSVTSAGKTGTVTGSAAATSNSGTTFYFELKTFIVNGGKDPPTARWLSPPSINSPITSSNAATVSGKGCSESNPVTFAEGDTISITAVQTGGSGYGRIWPVVLDPDLELPSMGIPEFDNFFSGTLGGTATIPGNTYTAKVLDLTTGGNLRVVNGSALIGNHSHLYFKITGDGKPTAPSDRTTSTSAVNTYYTTSFTVAGCATGRKAFYFATGGAEIKVNSGFYANRSLRNGIHSGVLAGNGDTVTVRAKSPSALDFKKLVQIYGMQGDGQYTMTKWTLGPTTNPDATYGAEFFNSSGNKLLSINDRSARFVASGTMSFSNHADETEKTVSQSITGLVDSDVWQVFAYITPGQGGGAGSNTILRDVSKGSGSFSVTTYFSSYVDDTKSYTVSYVVVKQG